MHKNVNKSGDFPVSINGASPKWGEEGETLPRIDCGTSSKDIYHFWGT